MKLKIFLILLLLLPLLSAVQIDINSEYAQAETLIAKISGNFQDALLKENIVFYRGHVRVPMVTHLTKIQNDYHIYTQLPERNDNYSISIEGVR